MRFLGLYVLLAPLLIGAETITVKTKAPSNRMAVFQYRVPRNYNASRPETYRVLVLFGGRNTDGKADASGRMGWGEWADQEGIFIIAPGLKDDDYWEPKDWSGKALQNALSQLKKRYHICTGKILYYGYSAGSQASNLFAAWRPELCRAWVSHACGVFHDPGTKMRNIPGLVTCGDADSARYVISKRFVESARKRGINIIWKSFPNSPHDVPPDSLKLARAFLGYYHNLHKGDLTGSAASFQDNPAEFIGDDQESVYYPAQSPQAKNIPLEDSVPLPNRTVADAWGRAAQ